jgi:hypothetical protein
MSEFTDKRYNLKFLEAQQQSKHLGLQHNNLMITGDHYDIDFITQLASFSIGMMNSMGFHSTSDARSECMIVHHAIQRELIARGIPAELTIGNAMLRNKPFIKDVNLHSLSNELSAPDFEQQQDIHCWLTLQDGSILDFTIYSSLTDPNKPEPLDKNYVYIAPLEHDTRHYYEPMLVGNEYLALTGAISTFVTK